MARIDPRAHSKSQWAARLTDHPALIATAITTAVFVAKVYLVAGGDPVVAVGIVAASAPTELLIGLLVVFFPIVLATATVSLVVAQIRGRSNLFVSVATWPMALLTLLVSPLSTLLVVGLGFIALPAFFWWSFKGIAALDGRPGPNSDDALRFLIFGAAFVWLLLILAPNTWVPPENYRTSESDISQVGFFIDEDGAWLTVLHDFDRQLVRIRESELQDREICSYGGPRSLFNTSVYQLLFRPSRLPACAMPGA